MGWEDIVRQFFPESGTGPNPSQQPPPDEDSLTSRLYEAGKQAASAVTGFGAAKFIHENVLPPIERAPGIAGYYYAGGPFREAALSPETPEETFEPEKLRELITRPEEPPTSFPAGVARGAAGEALAFGASPTNMLLGAGIGALPRALGRTASLGLAAQMAPGAYERLKHAAGVYQEQGLSPEFAQAATEAAITGGFTGLAAAHGLRRAPAAEAAPEVPPEPLGIVAEGQAPMGRQIAPPAPGRHPLAPDQQEVAERLANQVTSDPDPLIERYRHGPMPSAPQGYGNVIAPDTVRELFPEYLQDRARHSVSTQPVVTALADQIYSRLLAEHQSEERDVVLLAGGTGAGKTTAMAQPGISELAQRAVGVFDSTGTDYKAQKQRINAALDSGNNVTLLYVWRDPVESLTGGVLPRAAEEEAKFGTGRTIPLDAHAATHLQAPETTVRLAEEYKNDPRVQVRVLENGPQGVQVHDVDFLKNLPYYGNEDAKQAYRQRFDAALEEAHSTGRISDSIYSGVRGAAAPAGGEPARVLGGAQPPVEPAQVAPPPTQVPVEVSPGAGAPLARDWQGLTPEQQTTATKNILDQVVPMAAQRAGVQVENLQHGVGGWEGGTSPNGVVEVRGGPENVLHFRDLLGLGLQQTEMWAVTRNPEGGRLALVIPEQAGYPLGDPQRAGAALDAIKRADPVLASQMGFSETIHHADDGTPQRAVSFILPEGWGDAEAARIDGILGQAFGDTLQIDKQRVDVAAATHDWNADPTGRTYAENIASRSPVIPEGDLASYRADTGARVREGIDAARAERRVPTPTAVAPAGEAVPRPTLPTAGPPAEAPREARPAPQEVPARVAPLQIPQGVAEQPAPLPTPQAIPHQLELRPNIPQQPERLPEPAQRALEQAQLHWNRGLSQHIEDWVDQGQGERHYDKPNAAADLVQELAAKHGASIKAIFDEEGSRPAALLHPGDAEKGIPTVWGLGWKAGEGTDIHDHGQSQVAIHILNGNVHETVYHVPVAGNHIELSKAEGFDALPHEHGIRQGSTVTLGAPYIHTMEGVDPTRAVTIHAYYPPLNEMNYFHLDNGKLKFNGVWDEGVVPDAPLKLETPPSRTIQERPQETPAAPTTLEEAGQAATREAEQLHLPTPVDSLTGQADGGASQSALAAHAQTLGARVAKELRERGIVSLIGKQIPSAESVAKLASLNRKPYEVMHVVAGKGGTITYHEAYTSGMPGMVNLATIPEIKSRLSWLADRTDAGDFDEIYAIHNHPSGNPTPSMEDLLSNKQFEGLGPAFKGHVVINFDRFGFIPAGLDSRAVAIATASGHPLADLVHPIPDMQGPDLMNLPEVPNPVLGGRLHTNQDVAGYAAKLFNDPNKVLLFYRTAGRKVGGVQTIPADTLLRADTQMASDFLRGEVAKFGGYDVIAFASPPDEQVGKMLAEKMQTLADAGSISDFVTPKGGPTTSLYGPTVGKGVYPSEYLGKGTPGKVYGYKVGEVPSRVLLETPHERAEAAVEPTKIRPIPQGVAEQLRLPEAGEDPKPFLDRIKREGLEISDSDTKTLLKIADAEGKDSETFANALRLAAGPKTKLGRFFNPDKLLYMWQAGLLSKPVTWATKAIGDAAIQSVRVPERTMAGLIDQARSAGFFDLPFLRVKGGQRERFIQEGLDSVKGAVASMPRAMHKIGDAITKGEGIDWLQQGRLERQVSPMQSKLGRRVFGFPYRMLSGITTGAFDVAKGSNLYAEAGRMARQEGLQGDALNNRMQEIISAPDKVPGLVERLAKAAATETYGDPLVGLAKAFSDQAKKNYFLSVLAPFVKVPTNIARQAWMRTPAGFYKVIRGAQRGELKGGEFSEQLAKPVVGSLIMASVAALAAEGYVTGSGPTDPKKLANLRNTGWQPYSFKVGDNYISYRRIEPFASLFGTSADLLEGFKDGDIKTMGVAAKKGIDSVEANFTGKLYFTGLEDFFAAFNDPERALGNWVKQMEGSVVPGIVASAAQVVDPTVRKTQVSDLSPILSRIPGASKTLEARTTPTGEPVERYSSAQAAYRTVSPFGTSQEKPERYLEHEFARLGYVPDQPRDFATIGGHRVNLTEEEKRITQKASMKAADEARALIRSSQYQGLSDEAKEYALRRVFAKWHSRASAQLRPALRQRAKQEASV